MNYSMSLSMNNIPYLSAEDEYSFIKQYQEENNIQCAWKIITSNLKYVNYIVGKAIKYGNYDKDDLFQEGVVGLMKALNTFKISYGVRFISHAVHSIKENVYNYIVNNFSVVKCITTKKHRKMFFNFNKYVSDCKTITLEEAKLMANDLKISIKDVYDMSMRLNADVSLNPDIDTDEYNVSISDKEDYKTMLQLESPPSEIENQFSFNVFSEENKIKLFEAIKHLNDRERDILNSRWLSEEKVTMVELATKYNISVERIRQLEQKIFAKLRKAISEENYV